MKKIAILMSILFFAQAAYAGGTLLYTSSVADGQYYDAEAANGAQEASSKTTREGKVIGIMELLTLVQASPQAVQALNDINRTF